MSHKVTYDADSDCIMTWIDGELDRKTVKEFLAEVAPVVLASGCMRILNDLREAELILSLVDLYYAARLAPQTGIPRSIRSAVLVTEQDWRKYSFLETTAQNRGQIVKIFTNSDDAAHWLRGDSEKRGS